MKRIKIQLPIFLCLMFVHFDPAFAGSLKQLWNKLKYDNQRLDYYQPYSSLNYLSDSYPPSYNSFSLINNANPIAESSNLHPTVSLPNGLKLANSLQNNLPTSLSTSMQSPNNLQNLIAAESINNPNFAALPQQFVPPINHLSPEFLYDYGQKSYSPDTLRSLSLSHLTPFLLLSSLGTLSHKSLGHSGSPLTGHVPNGFLKGLTTYLSSYLPSSPRQRKRQIDRTLPLNSNPYSFEKMTPIGEYGLPFQITPLGLQTKASVSSSIYGNSKKYSHFNKKKPVKYIKPKWIENKMTNKKSQNLKKNKNQIKYSKLMNESGFVSRVNATTVNKLSKRPINQDQIKYSEPDKFVNENSANKLIDLKEVNPKSSFKSEEEQDQKSANRSNDQTDKMNKKLNDKLDGKLVNLKTENQESTSVSEDGQHRSIELTSNPPQTDNLEDIAEKLYSKIIKRISSKSNEQISENPNRR